MQIDMKDIMKQLAAAGVEDVQEHGASFPQRKAATFECKYACRQCGEKERYVSSRGCVQCQHDRYYNPEFHRAKLARETAFESGSVTYEGRECKVCKTKTRYTCNATCKTCAANKRDAFRARRKHRFHSDDSLIMWVNQPPAPGCEQYYKLIPALAAREDAGQWSLRYTNAKHLVPGSERLYTGRDVMEKPAMIAWLANEITMGMKREGGHNDIIPHVTAAIRAANIDFCRNRASNRGK